MANRLYVAYKSDSPAQLVHDAKYLVRYFCEECGFKPLPWMERKFTDLLSRGYSLSDVESMIESTSMAPRPSWAYLAAIIRNNEQMVSDYLRRFPPASPSEDENHQQDQE